MATISPKRKYRKVDPRTKSCPCGKPAVKQIGSGNDFWCQTCIDMIPAVQSLHERAYCHSPEYWEKKERQKWEEQQRAEASTQ